MNPAGAGRDGAYNVGGHDMTVTVYPKRLLVTAAFLLAFGALLSLAAGVKNGVAIGVVAVLAYALIEVLVTFNPAVWWREPRDRRG